MLFIIYTVPVFPANGAPIIKSSIPSPSKSAVFKIFPESDDAGFEPT